MQLKVTLSKDNGLSGSACVTWRASLCLLSPVALQPHCQTAGCSVHSFPLELLAVTQVLPFLLVW